jgi:mannose-6-phosphate isomerase-like protein (cupin superfamily)
MSAPPGGSTSRGQGDSAPLTGNDDFEAETYFPMLGMAIRVVGPGEPTGTYHWETEQEDFLVLSGEGLLIVEGQERKLRQWDFVHCPPTTRHIFVGAGDGPCVILPASSQQFQKDGPLGLLLRRRGRSDTTLLLRRRRRTGASPMSAFRPNRRRVTRAGCFRVSS